MKLIKLWLIAAVVVFFGIIWAAADNPYDDPVFARNAQDMSAAQLTNQATQLIKDFRVGAWINVSWDAFVVKGWGVVILILFGAALLGASYLGWRFGKPDVTYHGSSKQWRQSGFTAIADLIDLTAVVNKLTGGIIGEEPRHPRRPRRPGE